MDFGHFTPVGMRHKIVFKNALVINTCCANDTSDVGDLTRWSWANPTSRIITHSYHDVQAVSTEALWQGCKLLPGQERPDPEILAGAWRKNKGRRPSGAYAGPGQPLIDSPGAARRAICLPAFRRQVEFWLEHFALVQELVRLARAHEGPVYLRDHDTGRGVDRNGPMSHAWVLAVWLNTGAWPE